MKLRTLPAVIALATAGTLGLAGCNFDVQPDQAPVLRVIGEKPPELNRLEMTLHIVTKNRPQKFNAFITIYRFEGRKQTPHAVASFHRGISDIPASGDGVTWKFPDPGHNEGPMTCHAGDYYAMWRVTGINGDGTSQDSRFFYPYNITLPKYKFAPAPRRSWRVNCAKVGKVADPHGE